MTTSVGGIVTRRRRLTAHKISEIFGVRLAKRLHGKLQSTLEQLEHGRTRARSKDVRRVRSWRSLETGGLYRHYERRAA